MGKLIFKDFTDEIYTSESYRGKIFIEGKDVVIPCINVGVSNHPINPNDKLKFIDYSYIIFHNFSKIIVNPKYHLINNFNNENKTTQQFYIDSIDILTNDSFEIMIECDNISFVILEESRTSENMWIPIQTPYYAKPNLILEDVNSFISSSINPKLF